jgi:hypothetical protein
VDIMDLNGKIVQTYSVLSATQNYDLSIFSPGSYMIRLNAQYPVTKRLIKL